MPGGPEGHMGPMGGPGGPGDIGPNMNGMSSGSDGLDGMKNSPANGPGTPRVDDGQGGPTGMGEYGIPYGNEENDQNESAAIRKIKESMQEEAKRFEKETPDHPEYFMQ